ncbi:MAG: ABC transporter permease [Clostridium sp.]
MKTLGMLIKRNILVYIRNRSAVFFSLLSMIIIIGSDLMFLKRFNVNGLVSMSQAPRETAECLINSWLMAGVIVVNSVTVTLGVIGIMIEDQENKRILSYWVSPVSRLKLTLGYILAAFFMACIMCFITFIFSEVYIVLCGGSILNILDIMTVGLYIVVNVFSSACFVFFAVTFIHTNGAFSGLSTIIGIFVGFIGGIYIPIGSFPESIQNIVKCFPLIYGVSAMRGVFSKNVLELVFKNSEPSVAAEYSDYMGISLSWNHTILSDWIKMLVLIASGLLFITASILVLKRKQIRDR